MDEEVTVLTVDADGALVPATVPPCVLCVVGCGQGRNCVRVTDAPPTCTICGAQAGPERVLYYGSTSQLGWRCSVHYPWWGETDGN
jgi:hypothetical protein